VREMKQGGAGHTSARTPQANRLRHPAPALTPVGGLKNPSITVAARHGPLSMSPEVRGRSIRITFSPELRSHRGKLLSGKAAPGKEVHGGCFLRQRRIVLDSALKKQPGELARILTHELFHFAWLRLRNPTRRSDEDLLRSEIGRRGKGELGWSAEYAKTGATRGDGGRRTRGGRADVWRDV